MHYCYTTTTYEYEVLSFHPARTTTDVRLLSDYYSVTSSHFHLLLAAAVHLPTSHIPVHFYFLGIFIPFIHNERQIGTAVIIPPRRCPAAIPIKARRRPRNIPKSPLNGSLLPLEVATFSIASIQPWWYSNSRKQTIATLCRNDPTLVVVHW